jgi:hypothetical protein
MVASADGSGARPVPVLGNDDRAVNPDTSYACDPISVSHDGARVAVALHVGKPTIAETPEMLADSIVDTTTGHLVVPPVDGGIDAVLFRSDGTFLIRSRDTRSGTLTLLSADDTILAQVTEPLAVRDLDLVAYTR